MSRVYSSMGENTVEISEKFDKLSQDLNGVLIPGGSIPFAELQNQEKRMGYTYNITDSFVTDDTFREGIGHRYGAGANVYWTKDGKWDVLAPVMVTGVKGEAEEEFRVGEVSISKENIGLDDASKLPAVDTQGLLSLLDGESPTTQKLLDAIADRVATKLVERSQISNVDVDDINKVPTSALFHQIFKMFVKDTEDPGRINLKAGDDFLERCFEGMGRNEWRFFNIYAPSGVQNVPTNSENYYCIAMTHAQSSFRRIFCMEFGRNRVWSNLMTNAAPWSGWIVCDPASLQSQITANANAISTLNSKTTGKITMADGWKATTNHLYKIGHVVEFYFVSQEGAFANQNQWVALGTLPTGYRPLFTYDMLALDNKNPYEPVQCKVGSNGEISVYYLTSKPMSNALRIHGIHITS